MRGERRFLSGAGWPEFPRFNWWGRKPSKREASTQKSLLPPGVPAGLAAAWRVPRFCSSWRLINVTLLVSIETATFF